MKLNRNAKLFYLYKISIEPMQQFGGVILDGKMAFPNAVLRVSQAEADYWLNPANKSRAPAFLSSFFDKASDSVAPYITAHRFEPFYDGELMENPDASVEYDTNVADAQHSRRELLRLTAAQHDWVGAAHIAFPGIGHIRANGATYEWLPINYDAHPSIQTLNDLPIAGVIIAGLGRSRVDDRIEQNFLAHCSNLLTLRPGTLA